MMIDSYIREKVRQRTGFACEFCGITEADCGGYLTIDHFCPRSKGGEDSLDNLLYCCIHCNQYKLDYWPNNPGDPVLWNPRNESASFHFLELDDGNLIALTEIGAFTLRRLRLNRPPLIAYRLQKNKSDHYNRLLSQYRDLTKSLEKLLHQQAELIDEQQRLLKQQSRLLQILLQRNK